MKPAKSRSHLRFALALVAAGLACAAFGQALAQSPAAITAYGLRLDTGTKTATAAAGAATLNKASGVVTTEALSTAAGANYTLALANNTVAPGDQVYASVAYGSATAGTPIIATVRPGAGTVAIVIRNDDAAAALNGTLRVSYFVIKG